MTSRYLATVPWLSALVVIVILIVAQSVRMDLLPLGESPEPLPPRRCSEDGCHIIAAGMMRSATTVAYNIARLLLNATAAKGTAVSSFRVQDGFVNLPSLYVVLKTHTFDEPALEMLSPRAEVPVPRCVLLGHRDARDVAISLHHLARQPVVWNSSNTEIQENSAVRYGQDTMAWDEWCSLPDNEGYKRCCVSVRFSDYERDPKTVVANIIDGLGLTKCSGEAWDPNGICVNGRPDPYALHRAVVQLSAKTRNATNATNAKWDAEGTWFHTYHFNGGGSRLWERPDFMTGALPAHKTIVLRRWDKLFERYNRYFGYPASHDAKKPSSRMTPI